MNQIKQQISQILTSKQQKPSTYTTLLATLIKNEKQLIENDLNNMQTSILFNFLIKNCNNFSSNEFYQFLQQYIGHIYAKTSPLQVLIYQIIPVLLTKYVQYAQQKLAGLESCIKTIFNKQFTRFNKNIQSKELLMGKSGDIGVLYKQHFFNTIKTIGQVVRLTQIPKQEDINSANRVSVKSVLLLTVFNNLESLCQKSVISYLWMVYIYCGGTQQEEQSGVSLYLLEKKNMFSIFKFYMSVQEMSIILLTLYELSMQRKKNKFELLSAINMIHKKAANQSMFKLSEVAQSTIHLLQDQYSEAFS